MTNGSGKSDRPVVPEKSPNKAGPPAAEGMEGRGLAKGNHVTNSTVYADMPGRTRRVIHLFSRNRGDLPGNDCLPRGGRIGSVKPAGGYE